MRYISLINTGPHDGTSAIERTLDTLSKDYNVPIVVSAGNYDKVRSNYLLRYLT